MFLGFWFLGFLQKPKNLLGRFASPGYSIWLDLAGNYRIGLNIVRTGIIGVKGLVIEYGEYPVEYGEYSPTPSLKLLARFSGIWVKSSQVIKSWGYAVVQRAFRP